MLTRGFGGLEVEGDEELHRSVTELLGQWAVSHAVTV
jgi:hypothetical protein